MTVIGFNIWRNFGTKTIHCYYCHIFFVEKILFFFRRLSWIYCIYINYWFTENNIRWFFSICCWFIILRRFLRKLNQSIFFGAYFIRWRKNFFCFFYIYRRFRWRFNYYWRIRISISGVVIIIPITSRQIYNKDYYARNQ